VHNNLAMALFEVRGMRALANVTAHYERALQVGGATHDGVSLLVLSCCLFRGCSHPISVSFDFDRAGSVCSQLDPNNISALDNTSQVYAHLGMYDKAVSLLTRLVRLRPNNPKFSARLRHVLSAQPRQAA